MNDFDFYCPDFRNNNTHVYTELKRLVESGFDIGLQDYPIFDEAYRQDLNDKIVAHYWFRCIQGTADRFKFYINRALNEIMPYYNQLYQSELLSIDPLLTFSESSSNNKTVNKDMTRSLDESNTQSINVSGTDSTDDVLTSNQNTKASVDSTSTGNVEENRKTKDEASQNTTNNSDSSVKNLNINSKTPQTSILIGDIQNTSYADEATVQKNDTSENASVNVSNTQDITQDNSSSTTDNSNSSSLTDINETTTRDIDKTNTQDTDSSGTRSTSVNETDNQTENEDHERHGFNENMSDLLMKYRQTFLNIDMMIIEDPKIVACFSSVYY